VKRAVIIKTDKTKEGLKTKAQVVLRNFPQVDQQTPFYGECFP
jgi:hypothetical protein